jgi:uncharacterized protein (DUF2147 family)
MTSLLTIAKIMSLIVGAIAMSAFVLTSAYSGALDGVWIVQDRTAKVRIAPCGGALCGNVVSITQPNDPATGGPWLDTNNVDPAKRARPLLGIAVATGMKPDGSSAKWIGRVYSIDHGRDYAGSMTLLSPTRLKIEGCQLMICESEIWTKAE